MTHADPPATPFLRVSGLTKRLGAQEILRGVDLEVATGQTTVIIGRSGGGKSVFLKHLIGLHASRRRGNPRRRARTSSV